MWGVWPHHQAILRHQARRCKGGSGSLAESIKDVFTFFSPSGKPLPFFFQFSQVNLLTSGNSKKGNGVYLALLK